MSKFVPNSFQLPNVIVDVIARFLTGDEYKILTIVYRRRYGSESSRWERVGEEEIAKMSGVSPKTASKVLDSLIEFGLLVIVEKADFRAGKSRRFDVQVDAAKINKPALEARANKKRETNHARVKAAREKNTGIFVKKDSPDGCATATTPMAVRQPPTDGCRTANKKIQGENTSENTSTAANAADVSNLPNPSSLEKIPDDSALFVEDEALENNKPDAPAAPALDYLGHLFSRQQAKAGVSELKRTIDQRVKNQAHKDACHAFASEFPDAIFDYGEWIGVRGANIERFMNHLKGDKDVLKQAAELNRKAAKTNPMFAARSPVMLVSYLDAARTSTNGSRARTFTIGGVEFIR